MILIVYIFENIVEKEKMLLLSSISSFFYDVFIPFKRNPIVDTEFKLSANTFIALLSDKF